MKLRNYHIKAFTLMEGVLSLFVITFMILCLWVPLTNSYATIEEQLFFTRFEHLYRHHQKMALLKQEEIVIALQTRQIRVKGDILRIPKGIQLKTSQELKLDKQGGNHSLAKISFDNRGRRITYHFYLGSGNYQKTSQSIHSS
ncbi:competence type IV pilus minor pilin ComGD [Streptococcus ictaluri]|uniref:Competence protein CglD family protein n=1 Tax=Streptococcus ictaluri 707-05 TaxID=764299 RepID=G5K4L0_9STRE|nr:competence protein CglD family protein [Streptococcus ictaluri 707-05]